MSSKHLEKLLWWSDTKYWNSAVSTEPPRLKCRSCQDDPRFCDKMLPTQALKLTTGIKLWSAATPLLFFSPVLVNLQAHFLWTCINSAEEITTAPTVKNHFLSHPKDLHRRWSSYIIYTHEKKKNLEQWWRLSKSQSICHLILIAHFSTETTI